MPKYLTELLISIPSIWPFSRLSLWINIIWLLFRLTVRPEAYKMFLKASKTNGTSLFKNKQEWSANWLIRKVPWKSRVMKILRNSVTNKNKKGEKGHPCLTPLLIVNREIRLVSHIELYLRYCMFLDVGYSPWRRKSRRTAEMEQRESKKMFMSRSLDDWLTEAMALDKEDRREETTSSVLTLS